MKLSLKAHARISADEFLKRFNWTIPKHDIYPAIQFNYWISYLLHHKSLQVPSQRTQAAGLTLFRLLLYYYYSIIILVHVVHFTLSLH